MRSPRLGLLVTSTAVLVAVPLPAAGGRDADAVVPCAAQVHRDVLPVWMRGGFSGPRPRVPYVLGRNGAIGGVVFGDPLNAPPAQRKNNKVLWVPRHYSKTVAALWIRMQQMEGTRPVGVPIRKIIPTGPGPSYVDAPAVGCWRLTLTWSGRRDTVDLAYVTPTD
jgi:hypothetical protein